MKKITIAIDGFSSTGKSTIAKQLANKLNYIYIDTGAMYRAVTLFAMQQGFFLEKKLDRDSLIKNLDNIFLEFKFNRSLGFSEMYLNGINVEKKIRTLKVSNKVSEVATISEIRKKLVKQQQLFGKQRGIVMDGRDIGTVVFPDAEIKLFMTASPDKRAKRRYKELLEKEEDVTYEDVLKNVKNRDYIDSTREDSPLIKTSDAIEIDNSNMGLKEQFERIYSLVQQVINT